MAINNSYTDEERRRVRWIRGKITNLKNSNKRFLQNIGDNNVVLRNLDYEYNKIFLKVEKRKNQKYSKRGVIDYGL